MTYFTWYAIAICSIALSMGYKEWIEPLFKEWEQEAILSKKELRNNSNDDKV